MTGYYLWTRIKAALTSSSAATVIAVIGIITTLVSLPFGVTAAVTVVVAAIAIFLTWFLFAWRIQYPPSSHWTITDSSHTWTIKDLSGANAWYEKVVHARCETEGAFAWRDLIFGGADNIQPNEYETPNGKVCEIRRGVDGHYALISLDNIYNKSDQIVFEARRPVRRVFCDSRGWVAVRSSDRMRGQARLKVVFPVGVQLEGDVTLEESFLGAKRTSKITDHVSTVIEGEKARNIIDYTERSPKSGATYTLRWKWNGGTEASKSVSVKNTTLTPNEKIS